jgi:hypothetical protein
MRHLSRVLLAALLVVGPAATLAHAVTIADLINLRTNGVSDDILIALIQTDGTVFKLSADEIIDLKKRGLSDRVLLAMLLNGRRVPVNAPTPAVAASEPAAARPADVSAPAETPPAQPVEGDRQTPVVNVTQTVTQTVEQPQAPYGASGYYPGYYTTPFLGFPVFPATYVPARPAVDPRPVHREYWGFNGERRPDSWAPSRNDRQPPPKQEPSRRVPGSLKK